MDNDKKSVYQDINGLVKDLGNSIANTLGV